MTTNPKVLIDLNVILDVLQRRIPFYVMSARVVAHAETGRIQGWVAAHSITTLFYLVTRYQSAEAARSIISELLGFLRVATIDQEVVQQALALPYGDFEDAVQMAAALATGADYLVTRNVRDFKPGPLPVIQPAELLALL